MVERFNNKASLSKELPLTRRVFLKQCLLTTASLMLAGCLPKQRPEGDINAYKNFLLIADTHIGKTDISVRQANAEAAPMLRFVFNQLKHSHFDQVFQLGDMIVDAASEKESIQNLKAALLPFQMLSIPGIHLLGNHDVWNISPANLSKTYQELGLSNQFYGVKEFSDFQIVYLDLTAGRGENGLLPEERIDWLREVIYPDTPTFIFSHEGLTPQNLSDNYYFKYSHATSLLSNGQEVWGMVKDLPIRAVISAHLHQASYTMVDQTHMITIPSFTEKRTPNGHNPGVYSIFKIDGPHFTLSSFDGTKCIFNVKV